MALQGDALLAEALFSHLELLVTDPATSIAAEGYKFDATDASNRPYLQVNHLPNTNRRETFDNSVDSRGFLLVTVVGDEDAGTLTLKDIGAQVAAHFDQTLFTTEHRIRFVQPATVGQAIPDGSDIRVPVSIPYISTK